MRVYLGSATPNLRRSRALISLVAAMIPELDSAVDRGEAIGDCPDTGVNPMRPVEELLWHPPETLSPVEQRIAGRAAPLCQDSCVCRSNAVSVSVELTGQHEKLPK